MSKKPTLKALKAQAAELRAYLRATDAFSYGSIRSERRWQLDLLDALYADISEREEAARARAHKARSVAWNKYHARPSI